MWATYAVRHGAGHFCGCQVAKLRRSPAGRDVPAHRFGRDALPRDTKPPLRHRTRRSASLPRRFVRAAISHMRPPADLYKSAGGVRRAANGTQTSARPPSPYAGADESEAALEGGLFLLAGLLRLLLQRGLAHAAKDVGVLVRVEVVKSEVAVFDGLRL